VSKKSSYHHGDLRQALIDGAISIVSERDVDSVSLREVARQADVSHTAPYRHFADKEELLAAVAEEGFNDLTQALTTAIIPNRDNAVAELVACSIIYVEYAIAHSSHYRVMFGAYRGEHGRFPQLDRASKEAFGILVQILSEGQIKGVFRVAIPEQSAWVVWSLMHGLVMLILDKQIKSEEIGDIAELVKFTIQSLLEGLVIK
jgi:AcrR family transcriptional regulator